MLDGDCDEYCGYKRPCEMFDFQQEDGSNVELTAREHKRALLEQAEKVEEDMASFDSDEECNKSEYA